MSKGTTEQEKREPFGEDNGNEYDNYLLLLLLLRSVVLHISGVVFGGLGASWWWLEWGKWVGGIRWDVAIKAPSPFAEAEPLNSKETYRRGPNQVGVPLNRRLKVLRRHCREKK